MKIRTRLFLVFAILIAGGIFSLAQWMRYEMTPRYMEAQEDPLVDLAETLAAIVSTQGVTVTSNGQVTISADWLAHSLTALHERTLNAQIYGFNKQKVDTRVYVTDRLGRVLFDSDNGRDLGADYSRWRDVKYTLDGKYGARVTRGDPLYAAGSTMYITAPIFHREDIVGALAVGKPTRNVERFTLDLLDNLIVAAVLISATALLIGLILHAWLTRPLQRLQNYAKAVALGERAALPALGRNEVANVGDAMEAMRVALDGKSYVTDYVQALTHELKAPVAAIHGAAELLQEDMPPATRARFLANIAGQTERMQELIDRLLELAALEHRNSLGDLATVDLPSLLEEVAASLEPIAETHRVGLVLDAEPGLTVKADRFLLSKALTNIIKNGIEFSTAGQQVRISASAADGETSIAVRDEGSGIPSYALGQVTKRFYSLPKANGQKGSGLGLSFVKEIAELHRFRLDFASSAAGTSVSLTIPA
ncbi:MAG: two-component system sensor histidine kinase CreC [Alphaproteobacteria bacterium]|jgi:two-component system sensor histidine kinase CreC